MGDGRKNILSSVRSYEVKKYSACFGVIVRAGVFVSVFLCLTARAAEKHPFGADDWAKLHSAQPVAVAPDGSTILYRVEFGATKGESKREWKLIAADGSKARDLKLPEHFEPLGFTRDGLKLYGVLEDKKSKKLATYSVTDTAPEGKAVVLEGSPERVENVLVSPDGLRFAVVADPRTPDPLEDVHTVVENQHASLYVMNADGSSGAWWCPALHDVAGVAWSSDGSSLAVLSQTPLIGYHYVHSSIDVCSASGARRVADIPNAAASEIPSGAGGIAWTSGGKELAFVSTTSDVLTPDHVWTVPTAGGAPVDRTPNLAGSALGISGDAHGNVWVIVARGVRSEIDSFEKDELKPAYQWPNGTIRGTPVSSEIAAAPQKLTFSVEDPEHATNLAVAEGAALQKITSEGDEQLADVALGTVKVVQWKSKDGIQLEGIATFPAGYVAGKKYPFLVLPHGGPESNDVLNFGAFARMIAGMGYVVLQPEYRGSTGYGTEFLNAIYQHFGDRAYRDVDSATDFAIEQGWADPNRLAIFGWSAGGFMTSWTVTQNHRYRAAIEGAGITDWLSFMWTSDVQQIDYDQRWPDENPDAFLRYSAVMRAKDVTTPLLILHGAGDIRVPAYQGRQYYLALAARGKTVRMVTYHDAPHFPKLWEQRVDVFQEIRAWLEHYNP
jgi:dipeptidyl aminopeptidase/acylaminoacyl peptidase